MPNTKFDAKSFNAEAFKYMVQRVPNLKMNEIKKSRALAGNPDIRDVFATQNGTGYARIAMRGLLEGDAVNYDGQTNITATSTKTFEQGVVVIGRAKGFVEKQNLLLSEQWFLDFEAYNPAKTGSQFGNKPVLVFYNTLDQVVLPETSKECAAGYTNVEVIEVTTEDGHGYEMGYAVSPLKDEIMEKIVAFFVENLRE